MEELLAGLESLGATTARDDGDPDATRSSLVLLARAEGAPRPTGAHARALQPAAQEECGYAAALLRAASLPAHPHTGTCSAPHSAPLAAGAEKLDEAVAQMAIPVFDVKALPEMVQEEHRQREEKLRSSTAVVGAFPFYSPTSSFRRRPPAIQERMAKLMMRDGKRSVSERILFEALRTVGQQTGYPPGSVLALAVENATPLLELRSLHASGGQSLRVPVPVPPRRGEGLAMKAIVAAARKRSKAQSMTAKLAAELVDASKRLGGAVKARDEMHKDAERNKVNAHLRVVSRR